MPLALFDLDGTVTNPKIGITRSVSFALDRLGIEVGDLDSLNAYIGPPLRESFALHAGLSPDQIETAVVAYREYFAETGIFENVVYEGISECLSALAMLGWRLAIATSKPTVFAERILEHFALRDAFEVVAGAELDGTRDNKADVIRYALDISGLDATSSCFMIGDREHDVLAAKRLCIGSIGVTWGFGSVAELTSAGADCLVDQVPDLAGALTKLYRASLSLP